MTETIIQLNVHEMGILISSLRQLDLREENLIARDYGSASALYNKLYSIFERMDKSQVELQNDVVPSF